MHSVGTFRSVKKDDGGNLPGSPKSGDMRSGKPGLKLCLKNRKVHKNYEKGGLRSKRGGVGREERRRGTIIMATARIVV